ncbi:MAG: hypothetical protein FWE88_06920 [Phycisphaerae bacterium]|nr:hypothetical protein [Phycisphaerae bacterium]
MARWIIRSVLVAMLLASQGLVGPVRADGLGTAGDGVVVDAETETQPATRPALLPDRRPGGPRARPTTRPTTRPAAPESPGKDLAACASQYWRGQYDAAAKGFVALQDDEATRLEASVGAAKALAMVGKYGEALAALDKAGANGEKDYRWQLQRSEVLFTVGEYAKSLAAAEAADALQPDFAPTLLARGRALEVLGRKQDAIDVYNAMGAIVQAGAYKKDAQALTAMGQIMARQQVLTGAKASNQAQNILQNYFNEAYQVADKTYWPAAVAAGEFALSKHRVDIAQREFQVVERLNPRVPARHVGLATAALEAWQFERCLDEVGKALAINPNHTDALLAKAQCLMLWRRFDEVASVLDAVLAVNPNHLDALSLYAAVKIRTYNDDEAAPFIERVKAVNENYAGLPQAIGDWLAAGRQFKKAEPYLLEAHALAKESAGVMASLGGMYLQTGQEDQARDWLAEAYKIDDYRLDVVNYLNLLSRLATFNTRETEHFLIKADPRMDAILLEQVADAIEQMGREVCSDFRFTPEEKTLVEFFPTHEQFSIRITGRGWIGTVGASTGTVIVMVAPSSRPEAVFGNYHWLGVLRHEYTHTVTLAKTHNRIPHWFTEACAVFQQPDRRNYQAVQELIRASRQTAAGLKEGPGVRPLYSIKDIDWGFIRPKQHADRSLAYAQSEWMLEYIISSRKWDTVLTMLDLFAAGKSQTDVFAEALGVTEEAFDKAFRDWASGQVRNWGFDPNPPSDVASLRKQVDANPKDASALADYAYALANGVRPNIGEAEAWARKALKENDNHVRGLEVLAQCLYARKQKDEAMDVALRLRNVHGESKIALRILAETYHEKRLWDESIAALNEYKRVAPLDEFSYTLLARCYVQMGQPDDAIPNLIELHTHTMNNPSFARQIADLYRTQRNYTEALKYYREVTYINPYDASAYQAMAMICLRNLKEYDAAIRHAKAVTLLEPQNAQAWLALARIELWSAQAQSASNIDLLLQAKEHAERSDQLEPSDDAKELLQEIDEAMK